MADELNVEISTQSNDIEVEIVPNPNEIDVSITVQDNNSEVTFIQPKGDTGEQGIQGEKGEGGDSAYQIWLNAGNTGSEADFLLAIKGEKGDAGEITEEELTTALSAKVDKIDGKGLSTNDLTNELKVSYDGAVTNSHTHSNKTILDNTTASFTTAKETLLSSFNGASQLVQLDSSGKLPAVDGSNLINVSGGGGVVDFDNLGTVTTDITLAENKITTGYWGGTNTITLPTVTDTTKQVTCILDFTTATSSQPTLNKPALTGTIAVTNASATVTGTSTLFTTELAVGSKITIASVDYIVSVIASDTSLTLTATYSGTIASGLTAYRNCFKWSDKNSGKPPSSYSILSGVRNLLVFKSVWIGSLLYWEAEYTTYGGVETAFVQPALGANGTLGGTDFAVYASSENASYLAYKASDSNSSTYWQTSGTNIANYILYNPSAVKSTSINFQNHPSDGTYAPTGGTIYGSNDNSTYTTLATFTNSNTTAGATWNVGIIVGNQSFYKYYKVYFSGGVSSLMALAQITINGVYIST